MMLLVLFVISTAACFYYNDAEYHRKACYQLELQELRALKSSSRARG